MKLLFIAPIFFDYHKLIKTELDTHYDTVFFRSEVPYNSGVFYYTLKRLCPSLATYELNRYNRNLVKLIKNEKIERIFIIRGYGLQEEFFNTIKRQCPNVKIIHYQWDSIRNNPVGLMISQYADYNYTFDSTDAQKFTQFKYIPLFYSWDINHCSEQSDTYTYKTDLLFVGWYHPLRHKILDQAQTECKKQGFTLLRYEYLPLSAYILNKFTTNNIKYKDVKFRKISLKKYHSLLGQTKAVLDIPSKTQTGATMRTIETLSMSRKLISTNPTLQQEIFYNPNNIYIWNSNQPLQISSFLVTPFNPDSNRYIKNIRQWLEALYLI